VASSINGAGSDFENVRSQQQQGATTPTTLYLLNMLTLFGVAQVLSIQESRGRFKAFTFQTAEGLSFQGSLWITEGLLDEPVEGDVFSFFAFSPSVGVATMTGFRLLQGLDPTTSPRTGTSISGRIVNVQEDDFAIEYLAYDKATKQNVPVLHTCFLQGDRWASRKSVLRSGNQVHVVGTLEAIDSTDCDNFWVSFPKDPEPSPRKKIFKDAFTGRQVHSKPLGGILGSDEEGLSVNQPSPSCINKPLDLLRGSSEEDDQVFTSVGKGKGLAQKRPRRK